MSLNPKKSLIVAGLSLCLSLPTLAGEKPFEGRDEPQFDGRFQVVAVLDFGDAKLHFIDESVQGVFGFGILEQGDIDLGPLYEQGASALEIFLTLAEEGAEVPEVLYRAHEEARRHDPAIPETPRHLSADMESASLSKAFAGYHKFEIDTDKCWGWGDVNNYHSVVGNEPGTWGGHKTNDAYSEFRDWSSIPWIFFKTSAALYSEEHAQTSDKAYPTPFGHERALAMCVTHAIVDPGESLWECNVNDGAYENEINYRVYLRGEHVAGDSWGAGPFYLTAYGEGVRYRSNSSASRKYTLEVRDYSNDWGSSFCKERYEVYTRSRVISGGGGVIITGG